MTTEADTAQESDVKRDRPVVAVTMGDPAGIGPEVTVKAVARPISLDEVLSDGESKLVTRSTAR